MVNNEEIHHQQMLHQRIRITHGIIYEIDFNSI